jgi:threonine/homoserine/homoserine lactone efflux protein
MDAMIILFGILGVVLIGAVSPGPSFVLVSRIAISTNRGNGLAAALGMGFGGATFGTLALIGLNNLLQQTQWLYLTVRLLGGAYLIYLAIRIWRGSSTAFISSDKGMSVTISPARSFYVAALTQLSNPKTAIFYGSVFAVMLPTCPASWMPFTLPPLIFVVETGWYAIVAFIFSAQYPRMIYLRCKRGVERAASIVMGALGLKLVTESIVSSAVVRI